MRLVSSLILLTSLACAGLPTPPSAPVQDVTPKEPSVLHEATNGAVQAQWMGEPMDGMPPAFATEQLVFVIEGARVPFKPTGTLHFSDWSFDVFSPDGAWVVLLQDRHGPFHAVRTPRLKDYLSGTSPPDQVIAYEGKTDFRPVFEKPSWEAPARFSYVQGSDSPTPITVDLPAQ